MAKRMASKRAGRSKPRRVRKGKRSLRPIRNRRTARRRAPKTGRRRRAVKPRPRIFRRVYNKAFNKAYKEGFASGFAKGLQDGGAPEG
ncbi:hypothetical protein SAMN04487970_103521 [Paenibacillus tianmuensis]|uniref:Uncharacterized protein n=1 Tax=Paenibacillus tianmuensis TaxID=624147 RepID=A0A1G4STY8_9BACL|nr:hypothetical protein [Paenibacillus tianmuensis]SCW72630.1 hypothetical protein SAMN04487970_103521 [Paenibacillus tianmuensis]